MTALDAAEVAGARGGSRPPVRIAVVGVHGYGAAHVLRALELQREGRAELVGLVDPLDGPVVREGRVVTGALPPIRPSLDELLDARDVDVVVIATPLHTHAELATRVLLAGADVLLEKPPVTDLEAFHGLAAVQRETGGLVQVGFQSLGSLALAELLSAVARGELGELEAIGAAGTWTRDRRYWTRARWAGRRELDGARVADGAVSNPFAHAVMTSLRIAGWGSPSDIGRVEADLHRVNPIEVDDTSALRIHPSAEGRATFDGALTCAFTLAGPGEDDPFIVVRGSLGSATLFYTEDRLILPDGRPREFGRVDLMTNLIDARRDGAELLSPLAGSGGFVAVIEAVGEAPVHAVDAAHVLWRGDGANASPVLAGVVPAVRQALAEQRLFREIDGLEWAR